MNQLHTGITFIPINDIQLDASWGTFLNSNEFYEGIGFSFRIK